MVKALKLGLTQLLILIIICLSSVSTDSVEGLNGGFRQVALDLHNSYREANNALPLLLNAQLNIAAHNRAEELAATKSFELEPGQGYAKLRNVWALFGELRPLVLDTRDATNTWYRKMPAPENSIFSVNENVLYSNITKFLGIGVGTSEDYTIVLAYYL